MADGSEMKATKRRQRADGKEGADRSDPESDWPTEEAPGSSCFKVCNECEVMKGSEMSE